MYIQPCTRTVGALAWDHQTVSSEMHAPVCGRGWLRELK